jgi:hypothetical protein
MTGRVDARQFFQLGDRTFSVAQGWTNVEANRVWENSRYYLANWRNWFNSGPGSVQRWTP